MPAPLPNPASDPIAKKGWLRHLKDQRDFDRELSKILRDAANEGERTVARIVGDGVGAEVRRSQINLAIAQLRVQSVELWGSKISAVTQAGLDKSALRAVESLSELNGLLADAIGDPNLSASFVSAAKSGAEQVRSRVLNEIRLSDRVYKTEAIANGWVERELNRGLALGRSAKEIATSVRRFIDPNVKGGVNYAASRLGRTELNNAFHTTTIRAAQDQPWVIGFKWNKSGSHPRHDECDDYADKDHDGLGPGIYAKANVPAKPHPQCLCYVTTIVPESDAFIDDLVGGKYDGYLRDNGSALPNPILPKTTK